MLLSGNAIWRHFLWLRPLLFTLILVIAGSCTQGHADSCSARKELLWLTLVKYFFVEESLPHSEIQTCDLQFSSPLAAQTFRRPKAGSRRLLCQSLTCTLLFVLCFAFRWFAGDPSPLSSFRCRMMGSRSLWDVICLSTSSQRLPLEVRRVSVPREANSRTDRDTFMCPPDLLCCVLWMSYVSLFPSVTNAESHGTVALPS